MVLFDTLRGAHPCGERGLHPWSCPEMTAVVKSCKMHPNFARLESITLLCGQDGPSSDVGSGGVSGVERLGGVMRLLLLSFLVTMAVVSMLGVVAEVMEMPKPSPPKI